MPLNELEQECIDRLHSGDRSPAPLQGDATDWTRLGLDVLLAVGGMLRATRHITKRDSVSYKLDGSPTTELEAEIEVVLRTTIAAIDPNATVIGEETGGTLPSTGMAVAMDPVDGTWAFVTGIETFTTTLAVFRDGVPFLGMVMNPTTGEIAYAAGDQPTRLVHLSAFGEPDTAFNLPARIGDPTRILVNMHPSRRAAPLVAALYQEWETGGMRMVRSPGGSPAGALLEAAKGRFTYINVWSSDKPAPYDLVAGVMLVRSAGGEVVDLDGNPVDALLHQGPFAAGVEAESRQRVVDVARAALPTL